MSSIYSWFFPDPVYPPVVDDDRIQVLQKTEFDGITSTACRLVLDVAGNYYLRPEERHQILDDEKFPSPEGWPASAETAEEYLQAIFSFKGYKETRHPSNVSEQLSDLALNIPHERLVVTDTNHHPHALLQQVISDIRRRTALYINEMLVFRATPPFPAPIPGNGDEENAKLIFEKCVAVLGNDVRLANNALKLTTQATLAHLCVRMYTLFSNPPLGWQLFCKKQIVNINTLDTTLTTITYTTSWELRNIDESPAPSQFLKADVQIIIETDSLRNGKSGGALLTERVSPFFASEHVAVQFDLNRAAYPSAAASLPDYYKMIEEASWMEEELPTIFVRAMIIKNRGLRIHGSLDLYSDFRKLRTLCIGGVDFLSKIESNLSLERRASLLIEALDNQLKKGKKFVSKLLAIAFRGFYEQMFTLFRGRYENIDCLHILQNEGRSLEINIKGDSIVLSLNSIWSLNNMALPDPDVIYYFKGAVQATLPAHAITEGDSFTPTAHLYTSPFYKTKSEADQADLLAGTLHPLEMLKG